MKDITFFTENIQYQASGFMKSLFAKEEFLDFFHIKLEWQSLHLIRLHEDI